MASPCERNTDYFSEATQTLAEEGEEIMMRKSSRLDRRRQAVSPKARTESFSVGLSHEHASIFFDSHVYICTTCGFYADDKETVVDHIRRRLGQELLSKEPTIH
jgi:rubrerythrin